VRRATRLTITSIVAVIASGGCVDGFRGSELQLDLSPGMPAQAKFMGTLGPTDLPANTHFMVYAIQEDAGQDRLFELTSFEVHRIVDTTSPCFIDAGDHVPHPGLHVASYAAKIAEDTGITDLANPPPTATEQQKLEMATAVQRMTNVGALGSDVGIKVVTSASTADYTKYYAVAKDCTGSADLIPPAMCTDDASNQRRLQLCQTVWNKEPGLFEGTDRVLTTPLAGETHGMVDGRNPINMGPVGGAQFVVDQALDNIDAYAIYIQTDDGATPGTQLFFGRPTMATRGVIHVHLVNPSTPLLTAEMAVFADLGQDDVHF
jgi:hypothetical protein